MGSGAGERKGPRGSYREAAVVFATTAVIMVVIIAALQLYAAESGKGPFPLKTGDWIEYDIEGKVANESVGGEFIYYFMERVDRGPAYYITTVVPRAPTDQSSPFYSKPMLGSQTFAYDGSNLYAIGDLLSLSMSDYDGANNTQMPTGWFGEFVDHQKVSRHNGAVMPYTNGEAAHYISTHAGIKLEQWVANGTGLPIKLRYADEYGTDITLTIAYTSIGWIEKLPR